MLLKTNSMLYHCNYIDKCKEFVESGDNLIVSVEDGIWLGEGMYFWDNLSNANFWMSEKTKKDASGQYKIVVANVSQDRVLDLTDLDICKAISSIWKGLQKKVLDGNVDSNVELGKKLNVLYENIPAFSDMYHVIKVFGKYNKTPRHGLFNYDLRSNAAEPTTAVKCIYNVKRKEAILAKGYVDS